MHRTGTSVVFAIGVLLAATQGASAGPITGTYTKGGETVGGGSGPFTMTSTDSTFSILRFVLDTPLAFNQIGALSVDYVSQQGGIGAGAPRVVVVVDNNNDNIADGSFIIHLGPPGSFADPALGAGNTGNLLALTDVGRYDLGGIGGSTYTDRDAALAAAGSSSVLRFSLVLDSFGGNDRTFTINSINAEDTGSQAVPAPAGLTLLASGAACLGALYRRRRAAA